MKDEIFVLDRQSDILAAYSKAFPNDNANTAGDLVYLENFLEVFASRQTKINISLATARKQLDEVNKKIAAISDNSYAMQHNATSRGVCITIVVLADGEGPATLSLTYAVSNAWWNPHYDLRASVSQASTIEAQVLLHYRASVVQKTGEDWSNVALTLSTASPLAPLQGTGVPMLEPYWITQAISVIEPAPRKRRNPYQKGPEMARPGRWSPPTMLPRRSRSRSSSRSHSHHRSHRHSRHNSPIRSRHGSPTRSRRSSPARSFVPSVFRSRSSSRVTFTPIVVEPQRSSYYGYYDYPLPYSSRGSPPPSTASISQVDMQLGLFPKVLLSS